MWLDSPVHFLSKDFYAIIIIINYLLQLAYATTMGAYAELSSKAFAYAAYAREACADFAYATYVLGRFLNLAADISWVKQGPTNKKTKHLCIKFIITR